MAEETNSRKRGSRSKKRRDILPHQDKRKKRMEESNVRWEVGRHYFVE
jgi:hypothetical protein